MDTRRPRNRVGCLGRSVLALPAKGVRLCLLNAQEAFKSHGDAEVRE